MDGDRGERPEEEGGRRDEEGRRGERRVLPSLVRIGRRVVAEVFRTPPEREVDEELSFHVEMRVRELLCRGRSLEEARAEAIRRFDDIDQVKAVCRRLAHEREDGARRTIWWDDLRRDVALALRQLRRSPGFAAVAILTLALGIGANTAVFSVVHSVVLKPLPFGEPDELVSVWTRYLPESGFDIPQFPISPPELLDYRERTRALAGLGYYTDGSRTLTGPGGDPQRLDVAFVDDRTFPVLGVEPALGRWIAPEEDLPTARVVLLSWDLWTGRFGADSSVVGGSIVLDGQAAQVVGVMPEGFFFPGEDVDLWENLGLDEGDPGGRGSHWIVGIGRLAEGSTIEQARAEVQTIHAGWAEEYPHNVGHFPILKRVEEDVVGADVRQALFLTLAAVGLVLLVACVNVANLALARAEERSREVAVRAALGAGRGRMVRQFLTESLVLASVGGILGVAASGWIARGIVLASPDALPRSGAIEVSGPVLAFTALLTLGTALLFGVAPALHAGSRSGEGVVRGGERSTGSGRRRRFRRVLVGAEVALSVLVLVGAGLVVRSYDVLAGVDPGLDPRGVLVFELSPPSSAYPAPEDVLAFYASLSDRLEAIPGVERVATTNLLPLAGGPSRQDFVIEGEPVPGPGEPVWSAERIFVREGYFEVMGIELLRGRTFGPADVPGSPGVAVVSRELVRRYLGDADPVGRRVGYRATADSVTWLRVVGVVEATHGETLDEDPLPQLYQLQEQAPATFGIVPRSMHVLVRTEVPPRSVVPAVRTTLSELDPSLPVARLRTMEEQVERSTAAPRLTRNLLAAFGLLALVLAAVGIYGVVSWSVARRTREIGIRMALGAESGRVVGLVVREGAMPALVGLAAGLAAAFALGGQLRDLLFRVSPTDPVTFVAIPLLLLGVAVAASWIPGRRASRVPPTEALREG